MSLSKHYLFTLYCLLLSCSKYLALPHLISRHDRVNFRQNNSCTSTSIPQFPECSPVSCDRVVVDGLFSLEDVEALRSIATKGMATREEVGGPTILDLNTGYIRDSTGLENLFYTRQGLFTAKEFEVYGAIIARLKAFVEDSFATEVFFTAPTFITRLDGRQHWQPQGIHDEYWHTHADMESTQHYHYSGLLYLSDYESDFTGGRLHILGEDRETVEQVVEPRRGRVVMFTSGWENPHFVERLLGGQRFVLSFWFTCDKNKQFQIFLDGKAHISFSEKVGQSISRQRGEL